jgi:hypothetical protein
VLTTQHPLSAEVGTNLADKLIIARVDYKLLWFFKEKQDSLPCSQQPVT